MSEQQRSSPGTATPLPCPFCGGEPRLGSRMDEDLSTHNIVEWKSVGCRDCDVSFDIPDGYDCGTAMERWNTRINAQPPRTPLGLSAGELNTLATDAFREAAQAESMARLSASEVACYRWPEDTTEHRAMRAAFCDGAVLSAVTPSPCGRAIQRNPEACPRTEPPDIGTDR